MTAVPAVRVEVTPDGSTAVVTLSGEIDAGERDDLLAVAASADVAGRAVAVDLAGVTFMDSTGIGFLLRLRGVAAGRVRLLAPQPFVLGLLEVAAVDGLFDVVPGEGT